MKTLLSIPVFILATLFQTAIFSRIHLLNGTIDIVLLILLGWAIQEHNQTTSWQWAILAGLIIGYVGKLPFLFYIIVFLAAVGFVNFVRNQFWQAPLAGMFISTVVGTLIVQTGSFIMIKLNGAISNPIQAFEYVIFPGVLLNLLMALPIYAMMTDLSQWANRNVEEK